MVHKKEDRKYPIIGKDPLQHIGSGIWNYAVSRVADHYRIPEEKRTNIFTNVLGGMIDTVATATNRKYKLEFTQGLPLPTVLYGFGKGASTAAILYTVTAYGHEFPIYMSRGVPDNPTEAANPPEPALLKRLAQNAVLSKVSPLNGDDIVEFFEEDYDFLGSSDFELNGDYQELIDPNRGRRSFVRNSDYLYQQHGIQTGSFSMALEAGAKSGEYQIKVYEKTGFMQNLLFNGLNAVAYRTMDKLVFKNIEALVKRLLPDAPLQDLAYAEYKIATRFTRALFRTPSRLPLEFDMTDEDSERPAPTAGGKSEKKPAGHYPASRIRELYEDDAWMPALSRN